MKPPLLSLAFLACLIALAPGRCFGMMGIEEVSPDRAKALGITVRANSAGPDALRVELTFDRNGELKNYLRVDLEMLSGGKLLLFASLHEESPAPGPVRVSFAVDRGDLDKITLRIVTGQPMDLTGHELRIKDFVDLAKLH